MKPPIVLIGLILATCVSGSANTETYKVGDYNVTLDLSWFGPHHVFASTNIPEQSSPYDANNSYSADILQLKANSDSSRTLTVILLQFKYPANPEFIAMLDGYNLSKKYSDVSINDLGNGWVGTTGWTSVTGYDYDTTKWLDNRTIVGIIEDGSIDRYVIPNLTKIDTQSF